MMAVCGVNSGKAIGLVPHYTVIRPLYKTRVAHYTNESGYPLYKRSHGSIYKMICQQIQNIIIQRVCWSFINKKYSRSLYKVIIQHGWFITQWSSHLINNVSFMYTQKWLADV